MDVGQDGLPGQQQKIVSKDAEQEIRPDRDSVPTRPRHTMVGTVRERMSKQETAKPTIVKVTKSKS